MKDENFDLCVIGGGVNGAGVARDAAGRGLRVILLEARDLAEATSSASTKLVHGGLRYLEFFALRLVRDSLKEREVLLSIAPHIIWPLDFVLPRTPGQRPSWMIRAGLFLYDHLARRQVLSASRVLDLAQHRWGDPLKGSSGSSGAAAHSALSAAAPGFTYQDCWVDDSRLVALNALDAALKGAVIKTRARCTGLKSEGGRWTVRYAEGPDDAAQTKTIRADMVVNAAGPWVREILEANGLAPMQSQAQSQAQSDVPRVRLVKGSHIIVKRRYEGDQAYILQNSDRRILFVLPYEREYTLIGTTEQHYSGDPYTAMLDAAESEYLVDGFNAHFKVPITAQDVLWTYSGVRPLCEDGRKDARAVSREYVLHAHKGAKAPLISVFGGKITTYRQLAEQVVNMLLHLDNRYAAPWTAEKPLPGGDIPGGDCKAYLKDSALEYAWLPPDVLARYVRSYGTRLHRVLQGRQGMVDMGRDYGAGLWEAEIQYLIRYEFVQTAEDVLWRRSKLALHMEDAAIERLTLDFPELYRKVKADV